MYEFSYDYLGRRVEKKVSTRNGSSWTPSAALTERYVWDGENRLKEVLTKRAGDPVEGDKRLQFKYDYMNRRVEKIYSTYNSSAWVEQTHQRFVYDGWNVVMVLDGNDSNATLRQYTWGLDMSGLAGNGNASGIHGAGGVGGLLAAEEISGSLSGGYWYLYDGNGNIMQMLEAADQDIAARYEYDPYGNKRDIPANPGEGTYASTNPFRFSTKWLDKELAGTSVAGAVGNTGLLYYGERYLSTRLGRWINEDPIGEEGGLNQYSFLNNSVPNTYDIRGLWGWGMHYEETRKQALNAKFNSDCAGIIANWDNGVDTFTQLILEYHFDYDVNGNRYPQGRKFHYNNRWKEGINRLNKACSAFEVYWGLYKIGEALHSMQDGYSHIKSHWAKTPFDHVPSLYCMLDPFGIIVKDRNKRCAEAKEKNPNWKNSGLPDDPKYSNYEKDYRKARNETLRKLKMVMRNKVVQCHCRKTKSSP